MKKHFFVVSLLALLVFFYACQREQSFEGSRNPSSGSLRSDVTGDCLPKTVAGAYEEGVPLNDTTNFIQVQVDVSRAGAYTILSDTINGIWFKATGVFTNIGTQSVKLKGAGTPFAEGVTNFTIAYDTTTCSVAVTILAPGAGGPAEFTLATTAGACIDASVAGDYVAGTPLTAANTVTLKVNVTTIGTYSITTAESNGIIFSGTGTLGELGNDKLIVLTASGMPSVVGTATIPVVASPTSSCNFPVNVVSVAPPGDYFPMTPNSNWSYQYDDNFNDSTMRIAPGATKDFGPNTFNIFIETLGGGNFDSSGYYRKAGNNYIEFKDMGSYLSFEPIWAENVFLIDNKALNEFWYSATFSDGDPVNPFTVRLKYTITKKNVTATVQGITYLNTIEVTEKAEFFAAGNWIDVSSTAGYYTTQYAKNVGMIKQEYISQLTPSDNFKYELRRSRVL